MKNKAPEKSDATRNKVDDKFLKPAPVCTDEKSAIHPLVSDDRKNIHPICSDDPPPLCF